MTMIPLQFSFEQNLYSFHLHHYFPSHPCFVIEVSSLAPMYGAKRQYLTLGLPLYFSGPLSWRSSQPYIASYEKLVEFLDTHPGTPKEILDVWDVMKSLPDSSLEERQFINSLESCAHKLFVFPCEDEPVYVIALYYSLYDEDPRPKG
jgi:hypothetical protein